MIKHKLKLKKQFLFICLKKTSYSIRHIRAIDIFKRTFSLTKLQRAMRHSTINVSLTYLWDLEIAELKEEDMPMV